MAFKEIHMKRKYRKSRSVVNQPIDLMEDLVIASFQFLLQGTEMNLYQFQEKERKGFDETQVQTDFTRDWGLENLELSLPLVFAFLCFIVLSLLNFSSFFLCSRLYAATQQLLSKYLVNTLCVPPSTGRDKNQ